MQRISHCILQSSNNKNRFFSIKTIEDFRHELMETREICTKNKYEWEIRMTWIMNLAGIRKINPNVEHWVPRPIPECQNASGSVVCRVGPSTGQTRKCDDNSLQWGNFINITRSRSDLVLFSYIRKIHIYFALFTLYSL